MAMSNETVDELKECDSFKASLNAIVHSPWFDPLERIYRVGELQVSSVH